MAKENLECPRLGYTLDEVSSMTHISRDRISDCIRIGLLQPILVGCSDHPKQILDLDQVQAFLREMRGERIGSENDLYSAKANIDARKAYGGKRHA